MSKSALIAVAGFLWLVFFLLCLSAGAEDKLAISPTRIVFDRVASNQEITITNNGKDTVRYSVSFVEMNMLDNGRLERIWAPHPFQHFASEYVKLYPDKLTLAPGQSQNIRLTLNAAQLKDGEYRSHILLKHEEIPAAGQASPDIAVTRRQTPRSITLPVIVRHGSYDARLALTNMTLQPAGDIPVLKITLGRSGSMSAYGNVIVSYTDSLGNVMTVGEVRGVAIYAPNDNRQFSIPLKKQQGYDYVVSKLKVEFRADNKNLLPVAGNAELAVQKK